MGDFNRNQNQGSILITLSAVVFTIAISGCGPAPVYEVRDEFQPYVDQFQKAALSQGVPVKVENLVVQFGKMQSVTESGACEIPTVGTPTVTIKKSAWDELSEADRKELIFHELGHCVLYRVHNTAVNDDGSPKSIMNPYGVQGSLLEEKEGDYVTELFHP